MSFVDAVTQLTAPPGSLIYHITLVMSLAVIFSIAQAFRKNSADPQANRWVFASGSLLILRLILLAVEGLAWTDLFTSDTLLPAFDRFASLSGLLVFAWVFELPVPRISKILLVIGSLFNLIVIFLVPNFLPGQGGPVPFNHTMVDAIWSFTSLAVVIVATVSLLTLRPKGWDQALGSFAILTLGVLLHISQGPPTASTAGFLHFAEIVAYPLFTIGATRALTGRQLRSFIDVEGSSESLPSFEQITFLEVAADLASARFSDDESQFERQAIEIIARGLKIELCVLLKANTRASRVEIITGFDLKESRPLPVSAFDFDLFPKLSDALVRGNPHQIVPKSSKSGLNAIDSIVGRKLKETLQLFPLKSGREVLGGFLTTPPQSYPLTSPLNQARMREVLSVLAHRVSSWQELSIQAEGLLGSDFLEDAQSQLEQVEERNIQLEDALLALQQKADANSFSDVETQFVTETAYQKEIQRLEAEIVRLSSALAFKEDAGKDDRIQQVMSERQLALEELASVRNAMALMEQMSTAKVAEISKPEPTPDTQAFITIAEELRRPMSAIQIYTDLLLNESVGILGTMQENFLKRIRDASRSVGNLLNDLTRISPAEIGGLQIEQKPVNLMDCLDAAISMASPKIKDKNIILRIDFSDEHPPLLADEDSVIQILYHLLRQSINASPEGEQVEIVSGEQVAEDQTFLTITLKDTGGEISLEKLREIVQLEDTGEKIQSSDAGDPSQGLITVKKLVTMLGGRIWVEHKKGSGNTFIVLLPIIKERIPA
jgi:signal transduction histidine kinase